ncbi:MAG: RagB/SusD family nutrient uptake outer membrane protein [Odoribacter splanchnicus]
MTASRQYMIPLIRMSEMYLIAVECCKLGEASVYLNTFRNARNCNSLALTEDNRINILANEYKKEMLGEGQLFFFYKRQEMVNIPDGNQATGTKNVELTKYVVPLPESETDQRISSTDISNE